MVGLALIPDLEFEILVFVVIVVVGVFVDMGA
jgi:hypothetical protein